MLEVMHPTRPQENVRQSVCFYGWPSWGIERKSPSFSHMSQNLNLDPGVLDLSSSLKSGDFNTQTLGMACRLACWGTSETQASGRMMAQLVQVPAPSLKSQVQCAKFTWKERINSCELSSDFHSCAKVCTCMHRHTLTRNNCKKRKGKRHCL